mgnify:CR=1 FL=1
MADALEDNMDRLVALLSREAGKTLNDGVAEVREAADFCRYYALLAERDITTLSAATVERFVKATGWLQKPLDGPRLLGLIAEMCD